jgi:hypothetical protein
MSLGARPLRSELTTAPGQRVIAGYQRSADFTVE